MSTNNSDNWVEVLDRALTAGRFKRIKTTLEDLIPAYERETEVRTFPRICACVLRRTG